MNNKMWAVLLHLGSNMWGKKDCLPPEEERYPSGVYYRDQLLCEKETWEKVTNFLPSCGINTVLIDMAEGVKLDSHPELAVEGSWTKEEFKAELKRLRGMGLTPLPKYNFSCGHNGWMQDYAYMVGLPEYNKVCRDIVKETLELFDHPAFIHLGLEEEDIGSQQINHYEVMTVRSPKKKIEDALDLFEACKEGGARPWIWMDPLTLECFGGEEMFKGEIPKDVLVSNWYYGHRLSPKQSTLKENPRAALYHQIDEWGYEQVPTGSTWSHWQNNELTMRFCKEFVEDKKLLGYMTAPWLMTRERHLYNLLADVHTFGMAKKDVYG